MKADEQAIPVFPQHVEEIHALLHKFTRTVCQAGEGWCEARAYAYMIEALSAPRTPTEPIETGMAPTTMASSVGGPFDSSPQPPQFITVSRTPTDPTPALEALIARWRFEDTVPVKFRDSRDIWIAVEDRCADELERALAAPLSSRSTPEPLNGEPE